MESSSPLRKLPVTLLSGFLGSGKTTLLKHILKNKKNLRCAVIVNDMAELNVDAELVKNASILQKEEQLLEMQNGCICCTLRQDLLEEIAKLAKQDKFDYLIIESTGISEPMQVAETFTFSLEDDEQMLETEDSKDNAPVMLETLQNLARLDTCVTVLDCANFFSTFETIDRVTDRYEASQEDERTLSELMCDQIEFSNVILLNKTDLVTKVQLRNIEALVNKLNPSAEIIHTQHSNVDLSKILNTNMFDFEKAANAPGWLKSLQEIKPETEEYGVSSFVYRSTTAFHPDKLYKLVSENFFLQETELLNEGEEEEEEEEEGAGENYEEEKDQDGSADEDEEMLDFNEEKEKIFQKILKVKKSGSFAPVLRSKGFLWLAGRDTVHGEWSQAGLIATVDCGGPWFCEIPEENWPEEAVDQIKADFVNGTDRRQEIVFIGQFKSGDKEALINTLNSCLVTKEDTEFDDPWVSWPTSQEFLEDNGDEDDESQ